MTNAKRWSVVALLALSSGCMSYRGGSGVEDALEHRMGVELHRDFGIKLGPLSTKFAASFVGNVDDFDLHDLTSVRVAVFEVGGRNGAAPAPIVPKDLGVSGWSTLLDSREGDDQMLLLAKSRQGAIHEMVLFVADDDEVVVARMTGRLDKLIAKAIGGAERGGAQGAKAAVGFGSK